MQTALRNPAPSVSAARGGRFLGSRRRLGRRGAAASEFALVAVPTVLLTFGIMETAWQLATNAALEAATLRAVRFGATGAATPAGRTNYPTCRSQAIKRLAVDTSGGFLRESRLDVTATSYANFGNARASTGGSNGPGTGGQVVTYQLTYEQPWLIGGVIKLVANADTMTFRSTLTIKNEPFENAVC